MISRRSTELILLVGILVVAVVIRVLAIELIHPTTDVYYYDTQAVQTLLHGQSPYGHAFTGISSHMATPGAGNVFAYFPLTAIYLIPFYLLGDVRFGLLVADVVIGLYLYLFAGRWSLLAMEFFLLSPITIMLSTNTLDDALIALPFIVTSFALEFRGRRGFASMFFGLALATSLLSWLLVPFYLYFLKRGRWKDIAIMFSICCAIILPFLLADPKTFIYDVLIFQLQRPALQLVTVTGPLSYDLNLSLSGIFMSIGVTPPLYLRMALELGMIVAIALSIRSGRFSSFMGYSFIFVTATLFIVPSDFFLAYSELPYLLALAWISKSGAHRR